MGEKPGDVLTIGKLSTYLKIPKSRLHNLFQEGKVLDQNDWPPLALPRGYH